MISSMLTAYAVHENNNICALRLKSSVKIYIWSLRNWWNLFRFFFFVLCAQWIFFKTLFKTYHFFFLSEIWLFEIPHLLAICIWSDDHTMPVGCKCRHYSVNTCQFSSPHLQVLAHECFDYVFVRTSVNKSNGLTAPI